MYFIEVYKINDTDTVKNSISPLPISYFNEVLKITKNLNCKTIAIWKIKLKNNGVN